MAENIGDGPLDIAAEVFDVERRMTDIRAALDGRIAVLMQTGATDPEREELRAVQAALGAIGIAGQQAAHRIHDESIPEIAREVQPDLTLTEDEKFGMALRFVERREGQPFTMSDLQNRLQRNAVGLPANPKARTAILEGYLDEILAIMNEGGVQHRRVDIPRRGKENQLAFAAVVQSSRPEPAIEPERAADAVPHLADVPRAMPEQASAAPAVPGTKAEAADSRRPEHPRRTERQLSDTEKTAAKRLLEVLQTGDVTKLLTAAQIMNVAQEQGIDFVYDKAAINRIARKLRAQGIVRLSTEQRKGSSFKIGLASPEIKAALRQRGGRRELYRAIEAGDAYQPGSR